MKSTDYLDPPTMIHLPDGALPIWRAVIASRPGGGWSEFDQLLAAYLARCLADIARLNRALEIEPEVTQARTRSSIIDPRARIVDILVRRSAALTRSLGLHGRAFGAREDRQHRRQTEAAARALLAALNPDGCLE